jgi:hypothetical protein
MHSTYITEHYTVYAYKRMYIYAPVQQVAGPLCSRSGYRPGVTKGDKKIKWSISEKMGEV